MLTIFSCYLLGDRNNGIEYTYRFAEVVYLFRFQEMVMVLCSGKHVLAVVSEH
jgi:hypothetical protein